MRIAGTNIPDNKKLEIALTYIFGIGLSRAREILTAANISFDKKAKDLSGKEIGAIRKEVEKYRIEEDFRREIVSNIKRLKEIKCYRGIRHIKRLPVRGQRTKTNARIVRGRPKITMGSGRRKMEKT